MKEEILFRAISKQAKRDWPVLLITYDNGSMDLHCQTGDHHVSAIRQAKRILGDRGLAVARTRGIGLAASGVYYRVKPRRRTRKAKP